jgi:hypothetical protein
MLFLENLKHRNLIKLAFFNNLNHLFNSVSKYWTKIDRKRKRKYSLNKPRYFYRDHYF